MVGVENLEQARSYNNKGYGIFRAVNEFKGKRTIDHLVRINAWYVEIDGGDKQVQVLRIKKSPIWPSRVVESKNGYHLYFSSIEATLNKYAEIMRGLVHFFGGDKKVKDVARVLREPGFYHLKDPNNPFLVREIFAAEVRYRDKDMLHFFPAPKEKPIVTELHTTDGDNFKPALEASSLTAFLDGLDHEEALTRLSGTTWVNGEVYSFKRVSRGRQNIMVNGKSTSCFIDERKRIGASHGPTLWQWLSYYGHDGETVHAIISQIYPEVRL